MDSALIIRSFAYSSSHGQPVRNSQDRASNTMMKSSGLRTEPWWTPTPTPNSSLYPSPTLTLLLTSLYMDWTRRTSHSSIPSLRIAHQMTSRGTRSNAFSRSTKVMSSGLLAAKCFSCSWRTIKIASVVPRPDMKPHCISYWSQLFAWWVPPPHASTPSSLAQSTSSPCSRLYSRHPLCPCTDWQWSFPASQLECIPPRWCPHWDLAPPLRQLPQRASASQRQYPMVRLLCQMPFCWWPLWSSPRWLARLGLQLGFPLAGLLDSKGTQCWEDAHNALSKLLSLLPHLARVGLHRS